MSERITVGETQLSKRCGMRVIKSNYTGKSTSGSWEVVTNAYNPQSAIWNAKPKELSSAQYIAVKRIAAKLLRAV